MTKVVLLLAGFALASALVYIGILKRQGSPLIKVEMSYGGDGPDGLSHLETYYVRDGRKVLHGELIKFSKGDHVMYEEILLYKDGKQYGVRSKTVRSTPASINIDEDER